MFCRWASGSRHSLYDDRCLQRETRTIPIIFANVADPVAAGLVTRGHVRTGPRGRPELSRCNAVVSIGCRARQCERAVQSRRHVLQGTSIAQDYAEAMKWYRLAAEQRNPEAQFNLEGRGVAQDRAPTCGTTSPRQLPERQAGGQKPGPHHQEPDERAAVPGAGNGASMRSEQLQELRLRDARWRVNAL